jgi:hypothetical protein
MKTLWPLLLGGLLASTGCVTLPTVWPADSKPPPAPAPVVRPPKRPPSVHPDQVRASNAHRMAEALRQELDYDSQYGVLQD